MVVEQPRGYPMTHFIPAAPYMEEIGCAGIGPSSVCNVALPALLDSRLTYTLGYFTMRPPIGGDVNLQQLFHS